MPRTFIEPCHPTIRDRPPIAKGWLHEVKFDGYRVQLHKSPEGGAVVYSRTGVTFTSRFPSFASALNTLPAKSAIIDGELVAHNAKGMPAFYALHLRRAPPEHLVVWAFDLLDLDGHDLRHLALATRRARLERLIAKADHPQPATVGDVQRPDQATRSLQ